MLPFRRIAGFFCRLLLIYGLFILIYGLFIVAWPGIKPAYVALYSSGGNLFFRSLIPGGSIRFHPVPGQTKTFDTYIYCINLRSGAKARFRTCSRMAYLQTGFLASLILATPVLWRRRLWALSWGLILVNVAIVGKMLVTVLHAFSGNGVSLLARTWPWEEIMAVAYVFAERDILMLVMLPVLIWILVSFRRADWVSWVQTGAPPVARRKVSHPDSAR